MPQILTKQQQLPDFNIPEPYCNDIWNICEWDIFKNSDNKLQKKWNAHSNMMGNTMNFLLCKNVAIREELKYFSYYVLECKKINIGTFAEYTDRYKYLINYVNDKVFSSVLDIDSEDYKNYISHIREATTTHRTTTNNMVSLKRRNKLFEFINYFKKIIWNFYESQKNIYERDFWEGKELSPSEINVRNLNFYTISQPIMKQSVKDFIRFKLTNITVGTCAQYLHDIKIFCHWLSEYDESIDTFTKINRNILEDYFLFLRVESDLSQHSINTNILNLSVMFEYGLVMGNEDFPSTPLFLNTDYAFKTVRRVKFYTPDEIVSIFSIIKYLPKVYGKILMVLHHSGMRISEVLHLSIDCLQEENGEPYIKSYMYKTERYNKIPLDKNTYAIINNEIMYNKKYFPNAKYVFLNEKGTPIRYSTFIRKIQAVLLKNKIMGHDGQPLAFGTHKFRATKATELLNMGEDPRKAADMLGQKSLSSLSYYATATHTSLNEYMQEYLKKESILINSIGKMDEFVIEDYKNAMPLCNGWCCRPTELGLCEKANACLTCSQFRPSIRHLTSYQLQLTEVKSSMAVAKQNGYTRIVEKCEQEIKALEDIILRLEEMLNEKKH